VRVKISDREKMRQEVDNKSKTYSTSETPFVVKMCRHVTNKQ